MPTVEVRAAEVFLQAEVEGIPVRQAAEVWLQAEVEGIPVRQAAEVWLQAEVLEGAAPPAPLGRTFVVIVG